MYTYCLCIFNLGLESPRFQDWVKVNIDLQYIKTNLQWFVKYSLVHFKNNILKDSIKKACYECAMVDLIERKKTEQVCPNGICDKLFEAIDKVKTQKWSKKDKFPWVEWPTKLVTFAKCYLPRYYLRISNIEDINLQGLLTVVTERNKVNNMQSTEFKHLSHFN